MKKKNLTIEQALQKLRHFCRYQERCRSDVRNKLFELGIQKTDHDSMIETLIAESYLNEERFAIAFALGRFKMKNWGRNKILYELREKRVDHAAVQKAMEQIAPTEYEQILQKLAHEKYMSLRHEQYLVRKKKSLDFLLQKGFEADLAKTVVENMSNN